MTARSSSLARRVASVRFCANADAARTQQARKRVISARNYTARAPAARGGTSYADSFPSGRFARLERGKLMFLILFFVLLVIWLLGWAAFHVAGGMIHLLLILAVIS